MTRPLDHTQLARDLWLEERLAESKLRLAAVRQEAERIIATSRPSIQPSLRFILREMEAEWEQGDYEMVGSYQSNAWGD